MKNMWQWKPTILRRSALVVYVPLTLAWMALCAIFSAAVTAMVEFFFDLAGRFLSRGGWRGAKAWIKATWHGENVGEAIVRELDSLTSQLPQSRIVECPRDDGGL